MKKKTNHVKLQPGKEKKDPKPIAAKLLTLQAVMPEGANLLEALIQTSPVAIAVADREHKIRLINPAFSRIFGYALEECVGRFISDLIVPPDEESTFQENAQQVIGGGIVHGTMKRKHKDGSPVYVE